MQHDILANFYEDWYTGIQAILRFCLRILRGCDVGITDGKWFFNYAVEVGSGEVIHLPSFIKIGLGIQKLIRGIHRQQGHLISLLLFFSK
jgi:hypothetical protein